MPSNASNLYTAMPSAVYPSGYTFPSCLFFDEYFFIEFRFTHNVE